MATKCLFKILYQIHLFPCRPQNKGKLKDFHLNGDQNTLPNLSISTEVTKNLNLEGFHLNGDQVSFQNTPPNLSISTQVTKDLKFGRLSQNLFVSRQVTKELKIGRLSPVWRPSPFLKYSTKFICFHTGHK